MSFQPVVSSPNATALGLGVLTYFLLQLIVGSWVVPSLPPTAIMIALPSTVISSGVVLGIAAKRSPLMHGVLLGLLILGLTTILTFAAGLFGAPGLLEELHDAGWLALVSAAVFLSACSLGAMLGDFVGDKIRGL